LDAILYCFELSLSLAICPKVLEMACLISLCKYKFWVEPIYWEKDFWE
jgi:hypothetical protein